MHLVAQKQALLDRDHILKISFSVHRAGYPAYKSQTPGQGSEMCKLQNQLYVQL